MTNNIDEFPLIQSLSVQGLTPKFPPIIGEILMESTDQGVIVDSHVDGNPIEEAGEEFTSYDNP